MEADFGAFRFTECEDHIRRGQLSMTQTAAGLPENGLSVNASIMYCFIAFPFLSPMLIPSLFINAADPVHLVFRKFEVKDIIVLRDVVRIG